MIIFYIIIIMSDYTVEKCTQDNINKSIDEISPPECIHLIDYVPTIGLKMYDQSNNEITEQFGENELNIHSSMAFNSGLIHTEMASIQAKNRIDDKYVFSIVRTSAETYNDETPLSIKNQIQGWENQTRNTNVPSMYTSASVGNLKMNNPLIVSDFYFNVTKNDSRRIGRVEFHVNGENYENDVSIDYKTANTKIRPVKARIDFNIAYKDVNVKLNFKNPECLGYLKSRNKGKCRWMSTSKVNAMYFMDRDGNKYSKNEDKTTIAMGGNDNNEFSFTIPANTDLNKFKIDIGNDGMTLDRIVAESVGSKYWDPTIDEDKRNLVWVRQRGWRKDLTKGQTEQLKKEQPRNSKHCYLRSTLLGQKPYFEILNEKTFDGTGKSDIKIDNNKFNCVKDRRERAFELEINTSSNENTMMLMSTGKASKYKCFNIRLINGKVAVMGYNYDFTFDSDSYDDLRDGNWHNIAVVYSKHLPRPYEHLLKKYTEYRYRYCVMLYIDGHFKDIKWDKKEFDTHGDNNYLGVSNHKGSEFRYIGKMRNVKFYKVAKDFNYQCKAWHRNPWWVKNKTQEIGWGRPPWEARIKRLVERDIPMRAIIRFVDDGGITLASSYVDIIENADRNTSHRCELMITDFPAGINVKGVIIEHHNLLNIDNISANIIATSSDFSSVNRLACTKITENQTSAYSAQWNNIQCDLSSKIHITGIQYDDPTEATITIKPTKPLNMYQYGFANSNYLYDMYNKSQKMSSPDGIVGLTDNINQDGGNTQIPESQVDSDGFSNYFEAFNSKVEGFNTFTIDGAQQQTDIKQLHNTVLRQRSKMDQQLAELNKEKNTTYQEQKKQYDRTMFGGIVMSILATSLAYYTFTEI
jgi:hypothetical protein